MTKRDVARQERVRTILAAAEEVFVQDGFAQFGSRAVAARAEIRLSTLQYHFPTTEDLLQATVRGLWQPYNDSKKEIVRGDRSPDDKIRQLVAIVLQGYGERQTNRVLYEVLSLAQRNAFVANIIADIYREYQDEMKDLVLLVNPKLDEEEADGRAAIIVAQFEGLGVFYHEGVLRANCVDQLTRQLFVAIKRICA